MRMVFSARVRGDPNRSPPSYPICAELCSSVVHPEVPGRPETPATLPACSTAATTACASTSAARAPTVASSAIREAGRLSRAQTRYRRPWAYATGEWRAPARRAPSARLWWLRLWSNRHWRQRRRALCFPWPRRRLDRRRAHTPPGVGSTLPSVVRAPASTPRCRGRRRRRCNSPLPGTDHQSTGQLYGRASEAAFHGAVAPNILPIVAPAPAPILPCGTASPVAAFAAL